MRAQPAAMLLAGLTLTLITPIAARGQGAGVSTYSSSRSSVGLPGLPLSRSFNETYTSTTISPYYAPPGNFGMMYGTPAYGMPRTYSVYSSSYGGGYAYGYGPGTYLPGKYGVGLWRPGLVAPGYVYGSGFYQTYPVPYRPVQTPPVGYYAPGFGPPIMAYGW